MVSCISQLFFFSVDVFYASFMTPGRGSILEFKTDVLGGKHCQDRYPDARCMAYLPTKLDSFGGKCR